MITVLVIDLDNYYENFSSNFSFSKLSLIIAVCHVSSTSAEVLFNASFMFETFITQKAAKLFVV